MKNISVVKKMIILVTSAILGLVVLSLLSMTQMKKVFEAANFSTVNTVPALVALDNLSDHYSSTMFIALRYAQSTDLKQMNDFDEQLVIEAKGIEKALADYEVTIVDDKDRKLFEDEKSSLKQVLEDVKTITSFARNHELEKAKFAINEAVKIAGKAGDQINDHIEYNIELGKKGADEAIAAKSQASILSLTIAAIVLVLTALLGWFITRGITVPLNNAVEAANRLAAGDLNVKIEVDSKDETGQLLSAMKTMSEKLIGVITEVRSSADNIASASEQVSATAQSISQATNEQAASVEETSASVEQMSASINQNTEIQK